MKDGRLPWQQRISVMSIHGDGCWVLRVLNALVKVCSKHTAEDPGEGSRAQSAPG